MNRERAGYQPNEIKLAQGTHKCEEIPDKKCEEQKCAQICSSGTCICLENFTADGPRCFADSSWLLIIDNGTLHEIEQKNGDFSILTSIDLEDSSIKTGTIDSTHSKACFYRPMKKDLVCAHRTGQY